MMLRFGQKEGAAKKRGEGTDDDLEFDDAVMEADDNMGDVIIIGAVEDENGHPLKGAEVYYYVNGEETDAEGGPYVAETNEDGEYQISVPFGSYVEITTVSKYGYKDADAPAELPDAIIANDIGEDGGICVVVTDENGVYTITAPFGSYVEITMVSKYGYKDVDTPDDLPDAILANEDGQKFDDIVVELQEGMENVSVIITGTVKDKEGLPVEGAEVYYKVNGEENAAGVRYVATTDEDGIYSITVPFGSYVEMTKVSKEGYRDVTGANYLPAPVRADDEDGIDLGDIIISKESAPSEGWFTESVKALLIVLILLTVSFLIPTVGLYIHMRGKKEE